MHRYRFTTVFGFVSTLSSIAGLICFFINPTVTVVCGITSVINSLIQRIWGEQNSLTTEIITIFIAMLVAVFADLYWLTCTSFALCLVETVFALIGWIVIAMQKSK